MNHRQSFLKGALILSVAGAISKILGAVYRIPLARLIGAEGIGLYQMAYPIYTTILALATAGVPVAISILIARKETQGFPGESRRILRVSLLLLTVFGLLLTLVVIASSKFLAWYVLKDGRAYYAIVAVAPAIFLAALMSVFRGYFQGQQSMIPTAVSQVVEQIFRVTAVLFLAYLLYPRGLEFAAAGATFGAVVGGIGGLLVLVVFYNWHRQQQKQAGLNLLHTSTPPWTLATEMVRLAVPVSFGAVVLPLVQMLDAVIVPGRLLALNYSTSQATALYGYLAGMAAVLISLPTIFTISISTSLVPAISEALTKQDRRLLNERLNHGFRAGMMISFPAAAGLYILAFPICDLLYGHAEAGVPLEPLAFSAIVLAAFQISSAGLQGIGRPEIAMRHLIITGVLKVIFNYSLTSVPALNIRGAAIGTVLAFTLGSLLNIISLKKSTGIQYEIGRMFKLILATLIMALSTRSFYYWLLGFDIGSHIATLLAVLCGMIVYLILLILTREMDYDMLKRLRGRE
ncbi:MAG TPA: polysaccharide biosynthesis protein [Syntrophomonas sp.]|jgi:stage V sporulation protein B|nr:polysaccharide biosynthesis protein [Syntrophomonas sp.]